jgi:hypothetical protein
MFISICVYVYMWEYDGYCYRHQIAFPYVPCSERSTTLNSSRTLLCDMSLAKAKIFQFYTTEQDFATLSRLVEYLYPNDH